MTHESLHPKKINMTIEQIKSTDGTGTLSYLLKDEKSKRLVVIDPNKEDVQRIAYRIEASGYTLAYIIDTHTHADHVSGAGELRELFGAPVVMHTNTKHKWKVVDEGDAFGIGDILRANAQIPIDWYVHDNDVVRIGELELRVSFTPGHSDNHLMLHAGECIFTGDLLLIGQAGRSDLPTGNPEEQYESLFSKVLPLPDRTRIYPGHDYAENEFALLGDERKTNPFLQPRSKEEYIEFVKEFFPPLSESALSGKISLQCGTTRVTTGREDFRNIDPMFLDEYLQKRSDLFLVDVREPFELFAFGAIPGVKNIPIKQVFQRLEEFPPDKSQPIVVVCQTGARSQEVSHLLSRQGYTSVFNLEGGTSAWMRSGRKVVRDRS